MSTFDGKVKEFPDIRIDHFRLSGAAAASSKPPLAYFLSHVHSDHLQGLETCKSPFIYCSPATKAILLRLEKYPHRMNFAKGILETRKQTYRHLKLLLKTIPLATPTVIDLAPGKSIRVTLFDANHCVGAVMFLIEGDGKAILYTGDIRSELWWVNNLVREPVMLAYSLQNGGKASLKQLDCIYLDTTFASKDNPYKHFPSKLEGTQELLEKISKYPKDTVFYFDTWTFGYEDVWMTLSGFLDCQVHVDDYRYKLYRALAAGEGVKAEEAARLFGYKCGNHTQEGCLTERQSRLHSCEQGTGCEVFKKDFVRITPIISRHDGVEMAELGAGGGKGDLDQQHELEVDDAGTLGMLMSLCATKMQDQPQRLSGVLQMLASFMRDPARTITLDSTMLHPDQAGLNQEDISELEQLPIDSLIPALASLAANAKEQGGENATTLETGQDIKLAPRSSKSLPKRVTFPYSRHSSYTELCHLIEAFKPVDIWPCTVDKTNWSARQSMGFLFGHLYDSQCKFTHDQAMFRRIASTAVTEPKPKQVSPGQESPQDDVAERAATAATNDRPSVKEKATLPRDGTGFSHTEITPRMAQETAFQREQNSAVVADSAEEQSNQSTRKRRRSEVEPTNVTNKPNAHSEDGDGKRNPTHSTLLHIDMQRNPIPSISTISPQDYSEAWKREAFEAALGTNPNDWNDITLVSASGHQQREEEL